MSTSFVRIFGPVLWPTTFSLAAWERGGRGRVEKQHRATGRFEKFGSVGGAGGEVHAPLILRNMPDIFSR